MLEERILLVDDEEEFVTALAKRLRSRGFEVETVGGGEEAVNICAEKRFDAVILDLAMPGMDGLETLEKIRALDPDAQVIMLTGHGNVQAGVDAMKQGAMDFLLKPTPFPDLLDKIREAVANRLRLSDKHTDDQVNDILRKMGW